MKIAQEIRAGNVIMVGKDALVVQKAEFSKSGRNASVVKMKLKNLLSGAASAVPKESAYAVARSAERTAPSFLLRGRALRHRVMTCPAVGGTRLRQPATQLKASAFRLPGAFPRAGKVQSSAGPLA